MSFDLTTAFSRRASRAADAARSAPESLDRKVDVTIVRGAVILLMIPLFVTQRDRIADLAMKRRLPTVHFMSEFVNWGGLMAYGPSYVDLHRRVAISVDKILKGARPSDLPVEQPTNFEPVIDLTTARALGLTIPPTVLLRADHVVQ